MVPIADSVARYAVDLVRMTRPTDATAPDFVKKYVNFGASVRGIQNLVLAAKARALMHRRYHVTYEDIATLAAPILRHRILLNFHAESDKLDAGRHPEETSWTTSPRRSPKPTCSDSSTRPCSLRISGLELIAKTVVDGFVSGLHRSPDFGFSQEFAEYRAYTRGRRLAARRLERLRPHRAHVSEALSRRNQHTAHPAPRRQRFNGVWLAQCQQARFRALSDRIDRLPVAASSAMPRASSSSTTRSATIVPPSSRQGQFPRILHAIEKAEPGRRTDFAKPFFHCQNFLHRRGIIVVVSDFYEDPEVVVKTMEPMRFHGNEIILFHVLDPQEIRPEIKDPALVARYGNRRRQSKSLPITSNMNMVRRSMRHIAALRDRAQRSGIDYFLLDTSKPLDAALRSYLLVRQGRQ